MVSVFTIQLSSLLCSLLSILRKRRFERREKNEKVKSEENQKETTFFFRKSSFLFGAPGGIRTALSRFHPLPLFFTPARKSAAFCFAKLRGASHPRRRKKQDAAKAASCFLVRPEGFERHFPVFTACPYFLCHLGKVLAFCCAKLRGASHPRRRKKQDAAKAASCSLVRPEGFERHFPVFTACPPFFMPSRKSAGILRRKIARGFSPSQTKKNRTPQKRHPVFLVRPEGFEPPTF